MAGVTKDATSNVYVPANATEWMTALTAAGISSGGPSALYLLQEASGNPADSIGAFPLTAAGTGLGYQAAVSGWSRKGVSFTDGGTGILSSGSTSLPDVSTTSHLLLAYVSMPAAAPAAQRNLTKVGSTGAQTRINTTPRLVEVAGSTVTGNATPTGAVRPIVVKIDRSASAAVAYSDQEKLSASLTGLTGKGLALGNAGFSSAAMTVIYGASFHAAAAELTDSNIKTLLQTLNWSIAWS